MKFSCDQCDAQYMISDEKVGANGVKVRCKKCGHVIVVRRVAAEAAAPAPAPAPAAAPAGAPAAGEGGLDAELGHAFDQAFGDGPTPSPSTPDPDPTIAISPEEAARISAASAAPTPAASEWYVAIGQAQVGPLPLAEVKRKWEAGDVGPESLVWRPGMGDWSPLSTVADLAAYLAPVPRPAAAAAPAGAAAPAPARGEPRPEAAPAPSPAAPAEEVTWKPVGASALAALASEEIAARSAPEPRDEPRRAGAAGPRSLVDALPDGGGVDPTGAIPLPIKALETTGEQRIERRTSVARGAQELRQRRSATRAVALSVVAAVVVVAAGAGGVVWYLNRRLGTGAPAAVAQPPPPALAAAPVPAAEPAPAAPPPPPAAAAAPPAPVAAPEPAPPAPEPAVPAVAAPAAPPPAPAKEKPARPVHPKPPPPKQVARASPPPPPAEPPPAKKKKDSLLDFDSGSSDSALDEALGGKPARSVYVPPAPGGAAGLPQTVSDSQVTETILGHVSVLQQCVQEQKARQQDATGTLRMRWSLTPDGSVQNVKCLTPEYATSPFAQCLTGALKGIRFPRSASGRQDVTFPIKF